jgi:predicted outer membrane repeat protein
MSQIPSKLSAAIGLFGLALASSTAHAGVPATVYVSASVVCDYPTIQAAVLDLAAGSEIRLVGAEFVVGAPLSIFNRNLRISGGYPACGAPAPTGKTTLRADFSGDAVVSVGGNIPGALNLELRDLVITNGDNPTGNGGGLQITGMGQANLIGVDVHDNLANAGGGLYVQALAGGPLAVNLLGGSRIGNEGGLGNDASNGGGIFCLGARMRLGHVDIMANSASNQGGGLRSDACEILSTEEPGDIRFEQNMARDGGGIYARGGSQLTLRARLDQKISISHNQAVLGEGVRRGGGLYLNNDDTVLLGSGLRINDNTARSFAGGIIVVAAQAVLDRGLDSCALGDEHCSSLSGNSVRDETGALSGTVGGAFVVGTGSPSLTLRQTRVANNAALGSAVLVADNAGSMVLESVLLTGNDSPNLLGVNGTATLRADFLTVAGNSTSGSLIRNFSGAALGVEVSRSILIAEAPAVHLEGAGSSSFSCINTGVGGALGGDSHTPAFFDAAGGIYRLRSDSQNLDRCAADGNESAFDLSGLPRNVDRPGVPNNIGPLDRGAFEDVEGLFAGGFED